MYFFSLMGQRHEIFDFCFFFHEPVSPSPWVYHSGRFEFFRKLAVIFAALFDTGGKWKKSSIRKVLLILFGHLWDVELIYRYIFAFKFTLRSQQPDIVPIICRRYRGNNTSKTSGKICRWCRCYRWCTLTCEMWISPWIFVETVLRGYSWAGGETDSWKKQETKNLVKEIHCTVTCSVCFRFNCAWAVVSNRDEKVLIQTLFKNFGEKPAFL